MKLIAHRGWSQGPGENTLAAFVRASVDRRVSGVEFDVRRDASSGALLVTHDAPRDGTTVLTLADALAYLAGTDLGLFVELKAPGIAEATIKQLAAAGVADRSVIFAFADIARTFPWSGPRPVRLGAILLYPWTMHGFIEAYRPDVILLGWDERAWTRFAFRAWWSVFALERLARRHAKPTVVGIVRHAADLDWLSRQGVEWAVADMDFIDGMPGSISSRS